MEHSIDREKVIKGLDSCAKWMKENDGDACDNCPYHPSHFSYDNNDCYAALYNDTIALLKEQEPVIPIKNDFEIPLTNYYGFECECTAPLMKYQPYCMKCGKAVKWND